MPAAAGNHPGNHPGHQPATTQARHLTGQGQLPCAHKGPNFVSVTTTPGIASLSATYHDGTPPLGCGYTTLSDYVRRNRHA
jgi:hypothetical protein